MVFNFLRIFILLWFTAIFLFIFLVSDVSYAVEISSDLEYEKGSNKNKGFTPLEVANGTSPLINGNDPRLGFYHASNDIGKATNEIPHTKHIANISQPSTIIMPTSFAVPEENFYLADPKYTKEFPAFKYAGEVSRPKTVIFAKVWTPQCELVWHYFYGNVDPIPLDPVYSNLLDEHYADPSKFIPVRNQIIHHTGWSFRKNLGDVSLTTPDHVISRVFEYKSWKVLDVPRLQNELPKYVGMYTQILAKAENIFYSYGPDSLPTGTFKLPVSYDKMLLTNNGYNALCYSHKFNHLKDFQQQHAYHHCMHILKQILRK